MIEPLLSPWLHDSSVPFPVPPSPQAAAQSGSGQGRVRVGSSHACLLQPAGVTLLTSHPQGSAHAGRFLQLELFMSVVCLPRSPPQQVFPDLPYLSRCLYLLG